MSRATRFLLAALIAAPLLAACGNKGPLVLPDQAPKNHRGAPAAKPAPATGGSDSGADAGH